MASTELNAHFVNEFKTCILSNSSDPSLLEGYAFNGSVMTKLQSDYPIAYDLIKRKGILAEAIIHFSKKRGHSQGKMHQLLGMYFKEGSSELKSINEIFHLDVVDLYDSAYATLPLLKRFFVVFLGRYSKNLERFTGHRRVKKSAKKRPVHKRDYSSSRSSHSSVIPDYQSSRKKINHNTMPTPKPKKNLYDKSQRDNAWDSLGSELTKKKGTR